MGVNTVVFDLDGTLLYTLEDLTESVNYMLNRFGYPLKTVEEVKNSVGNGISALIERIIPDGKLNPNFEECIKTFKQHYFENMFNKTKPYDGVIDLLKTLKIKGYKTAVISNKFDSAVKELCHKYFDGLIDIYVGQSEDIAPKPSPDSVLKIISELGVGTENCIFVGDSEVDIETAKNSGLPCISVVWGYKSIDFLYSKGAQTLIYSPEELLELI